MNVGIIRIKNLLAIFLISIGLGSILVYALGNPEGVLLKKYHFIWPNIYIASLVMILLLSFYGKGRESSQENNARKTPYIFLVQITSVLGVVWGGLWYLSLLGEPQASRHAPFYAGHYFFSSILFNLAFYRINKRFMGKASAIIFWMFVVLSVCLCVMALLSAFR